MGRIRSEILRTAVSGSASCPRSISPSKFPPSTRRSIPPIRSTQCVKSPSVCGPSSEFLCASEDGPHTLGDFTHCGLRIGGMDLRVEGGNFDGDIERGQLAAGRIVAFARLRPFGYLGSKQIEQVQVALGVAI